MILTDVRNETLLAATLLSLASLGCSRHGRADRDEEPSVGPAVTGQAVCAATPTSLTPTGWVSAASRTGEAPGDAPRHAQDIPLYVSAAGRYELVAVDDRTLQVAARVDGIRFPDGIAYAPAEHKIFVSDESGDADVVVDASTNKKLSTIPLGGEAGNTHYDSVSHCILVAVQTRNQLVAIDPATERIVARYDLSGSDHPHGFTIDEPDVLAWDPDWRRLYVASEFGVMSIFQVDSTSLRPVGEVRAAHAHTISVDPRTHKVYLPLENVAGRPVLRVLSP